MLLLKKLVGSLVLTVLAVGCAAVDADDDGSAAAPEDEKVEATADELNRSPGLQDNDMTEIAKPAGFPNVWDQPDSTGTLGERGKCGPTAVANALRMYGIEVSPTKADEDGVNWLIGTRGISIRDYMTEKHPQLGCTLENPADGKTFLRNEIRAGHPVMVWFNTAQTVWYQPFQSHWVTAVAIRGAGANEEVVVMSWGKYYVIKMTKLDDAWRSVYAIRHPAVVCDATSRFMRPPAAAAR